MRVGGHKQFKCNLKFVEKAVCCTNIKQLIWRKIPSLFVQLETVYSFCKAKDCVWFVQGVLNYGWK